MRQYRVIKVENDLEDVLNQFGAAGCVVVTILPILNSRYNYMVVFEAFVELPKPEPMRMT